jgi:divalent metal cation (Fe/Co/Zn/Cd) transporter
MDLSVRDGHRVSHLVEDTVLQELSQISEVLAHVDPKRNSRPKA